MPTAPDPVASLWRAKRQRRRVLAALPLDEKLKILLRLQRLASEVGRAYVAAAVGPAPMIIKLAVTVLNRLERVQSLLAIRRISGWDSGWEHRNQKPLARREP